MLRRILDHLRGNSSNLILPIDLENSSEKDILQRLSDCTKAWSREINGKADLVDGKWNKLLPLPANSEDDFIHNWQACCETLANYTGPVVLAVDGLDHFDDENWKQIERLLVYPFQAMTSGLDVRFKVVLLHRYLDELKTPHLKLGAKYYKVVYMDAATGREQITQICKAILRENESLAGRPGSGGPDNDYHMRLKEILPLQAPD